MKQHYPNLDDCRYLLRANEIGTERYLFTQIGIQSGIERPLDVWQLDREGEVLIIVRFADRDMGYYRMSMKQIASHKPFMGTNKGIWSCYIKAYHMLRDPSISPLAVGCMQ